MSDDSQNPEILEKIAIAQEKKNAADTAFKSGDLQNGMANEVIDVLFMLSLIELTYRCLE